MEENVCPLQWTVGSCADRDSHYQSHHYEQTNNSKHSPYTFTECQVCLDLHHYNYALTSIGYKK